jgi:predicted nucleic-acid-binding Zn-ribbon protein
MKNNTCSKCSSTQIYRSIDETWAGNGTTVKAPGEKVTEVFATEAYLCLDCRHLEIYVKETSAASFGTGKPLTESIQASDN